MKRNLIRIVVVLLAVIALAACSGGGNKSNPGLANPASVHCVEQGGTLDIRDSDGGQVGICVFNDGSECDEWAFYRDECSPGDFFPEQ